MRRLPTTDLTTKLLGASVALLPVSLVAHPLHHAKPGFNEGLQHSLFSWEHILIAFALGFLAATIRATYQRATGKLLAVFTVGYILTHLQALTGSLGAGFGLALGFLLISLAGFASRSLQPSPATIRFWQRSATACALITLIILW